jgi:vitamin K-dependent gamma-carboxylase
MTKALSKLESWLLKPIDNASLAAFRFLFGMLMVVAATRYWAKGLIAQFFLVPKVFFPFYGCEWLKPLPGHGMYIVMAVVIASAIGFACGIWFRLSSSLLFLSFTYVHLCDKTNYLNHYYLISLLCLLSCFLPLHSTLSWDAYRTPQLRASTAPAWVLYLLRFQVGLVYFFGGIGKLKYDWLFAAQPLRTWLATAGDFPIIAPLLLQPVTAYLMSWAGMLYDITVPFCLLHHRLRPWAYAAVVGFHLVTARLLQIGMFPWIMIANSLLFLDPNWPRRILPAAWFLPPSTSTPVSYTWNKISKFVLSTYILFQGLFPFRHWMYPGNVLWTEQGYRFAWNVMLMEKTGSTDFTLQDPQTGHKKQVRLREHLTPFQIKMMSSQPDMILWFARWLAAQHQTQTGHRPYVFVDAVASLNGRPPQPLIDPKVDLASQHDSLLPQPWILPLKE